MTNKIENIDCSINHVNEWSEFFFSCVMWPCLAFCSRSFSKECNFAVCYFMHTRNWTANDSFFQRVWTIHSISSYQLLKLKGQKIQCQNIKEINRYDCWPLQPRWRSTKTTPIFFSSILWATKNAIAVFFPSNSLTSDDVIDCMAIGIMYTNRMICALFYVN